MRVCPGGAAGAGPQPVPEALAVRVGAAPNGYVYGVIDGDLVKLVVGTLPVVDAIDGLGD